MMALLWHAEGQPAAEDDFETALCMLPNYRMCSIDGQGGTATVHGVERRRVRPDHKILRASVSLILGCLAARAKTRGQPRLPFLDPAIERVRKI